VPLYAWLQCLGNVVKLLSVSVGPVRRSLLFPLRVIELSGRTTSEICTYVLSEGISMPQRKDWVVHIVIITLSLRSGNSQKSLPSSAGEEWFVNGCWRLRSCGFDCSRAINNKCGGSVHPQSTAMSHTAICNRGCKKKKKEGPK